MLLNEWYSLIDFKGNIYLIEEKLSMAKGTSDYFKKGLHSKLIKGHIVKRLEAFILKCTDSEQRIF